MELEQGAEKLFYSAKNQTARTKKPSKKDIRKQVADEQAKQRALLDAGEGHGADPDDVDDVSALRLAATAGTRPLLWMSETHAEVTPGQSVRLKVNIRNVGTVVETYSLVVLGPAAAWVTPLPAEISLFPGDEGTAQIVIRPPKISMLTAGTYVIGVKATSQVRWTERTVAEFTVNVDPYHSFKASMARPVMEMRRKASTFVQITNDGNSTVDFNIAMMDPDGRMKAKADKDHVTLQPGEPIWVNAKIKGRLHFFGRPRSANVVATITPMHDAVLDADITDFKPSIQHATVIQKPLFRMRLGFFGRMAILLTVLGLIGTFIFSRWEQAQLPAVTGSPATPAQFVASTSGSNIVLSWQATSGAEGYAIYAVGETGNPSGSASPSAGSSAAASVASTPVPVTTIIPSPSGSTTGTPSASPSASASAPASASASATPSASASASASSSASTVGSRRLGGVHYVALRVPVADPVAADPVAANPYAAAGDPAPSVTPTPTASTTKSSTPSPTQSPTASPTQTVPKDPQETSTATSFPTNMPSGTPVPSSSSSALPTPLCDSCTFVATVPSGSTRYVVQNAPQNIVACYRVIATAGTSNQSLFSPQACIGTGTAAGQVPGGSTDGGGSTGPLPPCAPVKTKATASSSSVVGLSWKAATSVPSPSANSKDVSCSIADTVTGWEIQKKVGSGWSDISPQPGTNDTATEISGLNAGTQYCFRMRMKSANGDSDYTSKFCTTTPAAAPSPSASASS